MRAAPTLTELRFSLSTRISNVGAFRRPSGEGGGGAVARRAG